MEKDSRSIGLALPNELAGKILTLASDEDRSLSSYVRLLLAKHVKEVEKESGEIEYDPEIVKTNPKGSGSKPAVEEVAKKKPILTRLRKNTNA